jgi:DnaJ domain
VVVSELAKGSGHLTALSRCTIGKNRWYWIVIGDWFCDPIAQGISRSPDDALAEAKQRCGSLRLMHATSAKSHWEKQRAMIRQQTTVNGNDASPMQFVYRCYWDYADYDSSLYRVVEKHRVVKKTKKRIFLEEDAFDERRPASGDWRDYHRSAFVLDRREFGSHGQARRSSRGCWYHCTYYADPEIYYAERRLTNPPDHFKALDLPADASTAEIKTAFRRLSRATHPDSGGKAKEFVRVRRCYEEAMAIASRTDRADDA